MNTTSKNMIFLDRPPLTSSQRIKILIALLNSHYIFYNIFNRLKLC
jgi:hypothetical protein